VSEKITVHIQFFSRLRDLVGASEMDLELPATSRASDLLDTLYSRMPTLRAWDRTILVAAGLEFVDRDYALQPGDQISIMPPLQGG
jgi:molybdopterin converting factor small subunit